MERRHIVVNSRQGSRRGFAGGGKGLKGKAVREKGNPVGGEMEKEEEASTVIRRDFYREKVLLEASIPPGKGGVKETKNQRGRGVLHMESILPRTIVKGKGNFFKSTSHLREGENELNYSKSGRHSKKERVQKRQERKTGGTRPRFL